MPGRERFFPTYHGCVEMAVGQVGLVMEFVGDGDTGETMPLGKVLFTGSPVLTPRDWFSVANDIVQAVRFVHDHDHILNDLKEDNVLLSRSDGKWRAVVIDFGWVRHQSNPIVFSFSDRTKTQYSQEGLYDHIAPEVALLDESTSTVSDVYQLGRLIRLIGARAGNRHLFELGQNCCHATALFRPSIPVVLRELDHLAASY